MFLRRRNRIPTKLSPLRTAFGQPLHDWEICSCPVSRSGILGCFLKNQVNCWSWQWRGSLFRVFENNSSFLFQITHWQSPYMHAYFPALNSFPSLLGDMLADAIGCLGFTWVSSYQFPWCQWLSPFLRKLALWENAFHDQRWEWAQIQVGTLDPYMYAGTTFSQKQPWGGGVLWLQRVSLENRVPPLHCAGFASHLGFHCCRRRAPPALS